MAYKIFNNTNLALSKERENGMILSFDNLEEFLSYEFEEINGYKIVEALWSPNFRHCCISKVWFDPDTIRD